MIELIADQRVAICQAYRARGKRHWVAARTDVGNVLPDHVASFIGFPNAAVVGVRDERMAVGEAAGKSHAAESQAASGSVRVDDRARHGVRDLEGLVVVLVGDEDVAVGEEFGGVGIVQPIVLPHDHLIGAAHLDDAVVALIHNQYVVVSVRLRQIRVLYWRTELVEPRPSDTERSILPDDFAMVVHEQDAVVDAGGRAGRTRARWDAGAGHQSATTYALGVIGADNSCGANRRGASSELPHD